MLTLGFSRLFPILHGLIVLFGQWKFLLKIRIMLFISLQKPFHSWDIKTFSTFFSSVSLPVGEGDRSNVKFHDAIKWQSMQQKRRFVAYLQKWKHSRVEIRWVDRILLKAKFNQIIMQKSSGVITSSRSWYIS